MLNTRFIWAIASGAALTLQPVVVGAQQLFQAEETVIEQVEPLPPEQRSQIIHDTYILGPGDGLQIELLDLPELSGIFPIGPDGTLYLPRLRALYVEGLTVKELGHFLTEQFSTYVRDPQVYVRPVAYRPIRIYVSGEVKRPGYYTLTAGYYTLSGVQSDTEELTKKGISEIQTGSSSLGYGVSSQRSSLAGGSSATLFPTVFDAIRTAQGITAYSNLANIQVTRKRAIGLGGGRIRTKLDLQSLITEGNESQNIRLFDGDVVNVSKSNVAMREQLRLAGQTNLNPQFMNVYVSGRVKSPGRVALPQGSSLTQALSIAGGAKLLRGKVEFIRFTREGEIYRRRFRYNPNAPSNSPNNPLLMAGDIIRVNESILSAGVEVMNELATPAVSAYSLYSLFNNFNR